MKSCTGIHRDAIESNRLDNLLPTTTMRLPNVHICEDPSRPTLRVTWILLLLVSALFIAGCDTEGSEDDETMVSRFGDSESHNAGANCMACHRTGGSGEGVFVVAGTVFREDLTTVNPGTIVRLLSNPDRAVLMALEVDARGNFYTTESLDFEEGLLTEVLSGDNTRVMTTPISAGACNSCHGETVSVINIPAPPQ